MWLGGPCHIARTDIGRGSGRAPARSGVACPKNVQRQYLTCPSELVRVSPLRLRKGARETREKTRKGMSGVGWEAHVTSRDPTAFYHWFSPISTLERFIDVRCRTRGSASLPPRHRAPKRGRKQKIRETSISFRLAEIMKNTEIGVIFDNYSVVAALCSFRLLFRRRVGLALSSPKRVPAFQQGFLLFDGRALPFGLGSPKPSPPWGSRPDFRPAQFSPRLRCRSGCVATGLSPGPG